MCGKDEDVKKLTPDERYLKGLEIVQRSQRFNMIVVGIVFVLVLILMWWNP